MLGDKKLGSLPLSQLLAGCFWICLAALVLFGLSSLPLAEKGAVGPRAFPSALAVFLVALSVLYLFQSRKQEGVGLFEGEKRDIFKMSLLIFLSLGAAYAWEKLGAFPVLLIFCVTELRWVEDYPWKKVIGLSVLFTAGVWLVFTKALGLNLPMGILLGFMS